MNWKSIDWKYIVMFVVTLVCALVPVLWQSKQEARAITVKLLSSTTLQLEQQAGIKDLQVTINGRNIDRPYLSLLQVVNDGAKPILSSDFETPIELFAKNEALVVSAQVTDTSPAGITAKISTDDKRATIAPFLVNPEDSVFLTILTSGGAPSFEAKARIAGVKGVNYIDSSLPAPHRVGFVLRIVAALSMLTLYFVYMASASRKLIVSRPLAYMTGITCIVGAVFTIETVEAEVEAFLPLGKAGLLILILVVAGLGARQIAKRLDRASFR
ncbi:hypothetical protein AYK59_06075 [Pseudomonas synxantha]|uniref:hypothetical protein n=1 Tax=Pseudomonas synxantha TaxID=47883 RepID=UPI00078D82A5|nr:hypothetical protein [Pseudomonas synxantha]AMS19704.1 hypothetical protein AYK59_06075 [Pseudomonas synxantha]